MKKNLRIVSAAAAALLAVAPVAASAVSVNAAAKTEITLGGNNAAALTGDVTVNSNISATTKPNTTTVDNTTGVAVPSDWDGNISGTVSASWNGQSYTGNLGENSVVAIWEKKSIGRTDDATHVTSYNNNLEHDYAKVNPGKTGLYHLNPGRQYFVQVTGVSFNFGTANANLRNKTMVGSKNLKFLSNVKTDGTAGTNSFYTVYNKMTFDTTQNGAMEGSVDLFVPVTPVDTASTRSVSFYQRDNGNEVQNGSLTLNANSNQQLNVQAIADAFNAKYGAHQFEGGNQYTSAKVTTDVKAITDQLNKLGMTVDANGYFTANKSFTLNFEAKSNENAYATTMPVTVSVPNGKDATPAQETTKNVTIMHISTVYDKNGKATTEPALRAYDTYSVVSEPVTINGAKFYKLAGKDQYIKVGNVDGTSRSLKHNSYVYKSSGKRANKKTLKKGSSVTTYGKSFMIAGHQMYRIGKNQYVKKANF